MGLEYYASVAAYQAHVGTILREHREIVDHIKAMRAAEAEAAAHTHAELGRHRVVDYMSINQSTDIVIGP
jgi:DNA-binding GntR family transcriptional regulator